MTQQTFMQPIQFENDSNVRIEAYWNDKGPLPASVSKIEKLPFRDISIQIETISNEIVKSVKKIEFDKISVKFGLSFGIETGSLTALLVKGTGNANLEITLEWSKHENPIAQ